MVEYFKMTDQNFWICYFLDLDPLCMLHGVPEKLVEVAAKPKLTIC